MNGALTEAQAQLARTREGMAQTGTATSTRYRQNTGTRKMR